MYFHLIGQKYVKQLLQAARKIGKSNIQRLDIELE